MRKLDIIRKKRRFEMFSEKTKEKVLELNAFFGKYNMHFEEKIKKTFIYYDTPNLDLQKSNIVLFKTVIGNFCELNMATEKTNTTIKYVVRENFKHFTTKMKAHESILKYKDFLIDNFKNMFLSGVNFDPEFLMRKLQVAYVIETTSNEYRSMNVTGLKITYSFDHDIYTNNFTNIKAEGNILTIYQHSPEKTDADFDDLMSKLERYLKELTYTTETKIMIARKKTAARLEQILNQKRELEQKKLLAKKSKNKK